MNEIINTITILILSLLMFLHISMSHAGEEHQELEPINEEIRVCSRVDDAVLVDIEEGIGPCRPYIEEIEYTTEGEL